MDDIYGPIRKARTSILLFVVPAALLVVVSVGLMYEGSIRAAINNPVTYIAVVLGVIATVWGLIFLSRPVVTLSRQGVVLPNGRALKWADISDAQAGQSTTRFATTSGGNRTVVHEVVQLIEVSGVQVEVVTTWAAIGPQAANDRIIAAFDENNEP